MIALTQEMVKAAFDYDATTGVLTWKVRPRSHFVDDRIHAIWNTKHAGKAAGRKDGRYLMVTFGGKRHLAHRLVWLWVHGVWPKIIDHINHNSFDNRIANLRSVSLSDNCRNQRLHVTNTSGVVGVHWRTRDRRWIAQIYVDKKLTYLGSFLTKEDASAVRAKAEVELGYHPNHGRAAA